MSKIKKPDSKTYSHRIETSLIEEYHAVLDLLPLSVSPKDLQIGYMKFVIEQMKKFKNGSPEHILNYTICNGSFVIVDPDVKSRKIVICDSDGVTNE